jgi:hypothetical protein
MGDEIQVATELQDRVFADRMMRRQEGAKAHASHGNLLFDQRGIL